MVPCFCPPASPRSATATVPVAEFRGPSILDRARRSDRRSIIGFVDFRNPKGEPLEAILDHRGRWSCPRLPVLDRVLNTLYEPGRVDGGGSPFGYRALILVAEWLKGEVRIPRA